MPAKRFKELILVTTAPYKRDLTDKWLDDGAISIDDAERYDRNANLMPKDWQLESFDPFGSADCQCDICNSQN